MRLPMQPGGLQLVAKFTDPTRTELDGSDFEVTSWRDGKFRTAMFARGQIVSDNHLKMSIMAKTYRYLDDRE